MVTGVLDEIQVNFVNVSRTLRLVITIEQKVLNFLVNYLQQGEYLQTCSPLPVSQD